MPYRDRTLFEEIVEEVRVSSGWFILAWVLSALAHGLLLFFLMQIGFAAAKPARRSEVKASLKTEEETVLPEVPEEIKEIDDFTADSRGNPLIAVMSVRDDVPSEMADEEPIEPMNVDPLLEHAGVEELAIGEPVVFSVRVDELGVDRPRGVYARRTRRGRAYARRYGATRGSDAAVEAGLRWLAETQEADGHWNCAKFGGRGYDLGVTGLATLALLGAGHTHSGQQYSRTVRKALNWMVARQRANGHLGWKTFYEQGIATMALSEDHGMNPSRKYRDAAQRAINHIVAKMAANGGFGYTGPGNDTSVTGWQIMALKSAKLSRLKVPDRAISKSKHYLAISILPDGSTGYQGNTRPGIAMTSVGLLCRQFLGYPRTDTNVMKAANLIKRTGPQLNNEYYTYYATLAMFEMGGAYWREWNSRFRDRVAAMQVRDRGPMHGSWNPAGKSYGTQGGRVYVTAMYVLSLEAYYRFLPVYRR